MGRLTNNNANSHKLSTTQAQQSKSFRYQFFKNDFVPKHLRATISNNKKHTFPKYFKFLIHLSNI